MAERRMFSMTIIDSDAFLNMPVTAQLLYFHLAMRADDEGFVNSPRKIARLIGLEDDTLDILINNSFVIGFDSGVVVIKHWNINNKLRKDRYKETNYTEERALLSLKDNGAYTFKNPDKKVRDNQMSTKCQPNDNQMSTKCQPNDNQMTTQYSIGKDSIDYNTVYSPYSPIHCSSLRNLTDEAEEGTQNAKTSSDIDEVVEEWNALSKYGIKPVRKITSETKRHKYLKARILQYGIEGVIEAIRNVGKSEFLHGHNKNGWMATFDWFILPNNFIKVLEGNFDNKTPHGGGTGDRLDFIREWAEAEGADPV